MATTNGISIDDLIDRATALCAGLSPAYAPYAGRIAELRERLAQGALHFAVLGQFNRGKSTFLNVLLGRQVLPTSVLPLTSIPTIIRYGAEDACTISFLDDKPPVEIVGSLDRIREALTIHVTEEKNPENRLRVKDVTVRTPSTVLRGGTVLIDTPGFGSTFVHNTRTTIDLLTQCDAAFMMLSAELPITQAEVEFLREVRVYVPRVFYVYNKVDLLSGDELSATMAFIKDEIIRNFGYAPDLQLIPVSSRTAAGAQRQADDDTAWRNSGMGAIVAAINQFLSAEKYFALARALNRKFAEALGHIRDGLDKEISDLRTPIQQMHHRLASAREHAETLRSAMTDELNRLSDECARVRAAADAAIDLERQSAHQGAERLVHEVADHERGGGLFARRVEAALEGLVAQAERGMAARAALAASGPLREAGARHRAELQRIAASIAGMVREARREVDITLEVPPLLETAPETDAAQIDLCAVRAPLLARFMPSAQRTELLADQILPQVKAAVEGRLGRCAQALRDRIDDGWSAFSRDLKTLVHALTSQLDSIDAERSAELQSAEDHARPALERLEALAKGFAEIAGEVRD